MHLLRIAYFSPSVFLCLLRSDRRRCVCADRVMREKRMCACRLDMFLFLSVRMGEKTSKSCCGDCLSIWTSMFVSCLNMHMQSKRKHKIKHVPNRLECASRVDCGCRRQCDCWSLTVCVDPQHPNPFLIEWSHLSTTRDCHKWRSNHNSRCVFSAPTVD